MMMVFEEEAYYSCSSSSDEGKEGKEDEASWLQSQPWLNEYTAAKFLDFSGRLKVDEDHPTPADPIASFEVAAGASWYLRAAETAVMRPHDYDFAYDEALNDDAKEKGEMDEVDRVDLLLSEFEPADKDEGENELTWHTARISTPCCWAEIQPQEIVRCPKSEIPENTDVVHNTKPCSSDEPCWPDEPSWPYGMSLPENNNSSKILSEDDEDEDDEDGEPDEIFPEVRNKSEPVVILPLVILPGDHDNSNKPVVSLRGDHDPDVILPGYLDNSNPDVSLPEDHGNSNPDVILLGDHGNINPDVILPEDHTNSNPDVILLGDDDNSNPDVIPLDDLENSTLSHDRILLSHEESLALFRKDLKRKFTLGDHFLWISVDRTEKMHIELQKNRELPDHFEAHLRIVAHRLKKMAELNYLTELDHFKLHGLLDNLEVSIWYPMHGPLYKHLKLHCFKKTGRRSTNIPHVDSIPTDEVSDQEFVKLYDDLLDIVKKHHKSLLKKEDRVAIMGDMRKLGKERMEEGKLSFELVLRALIYAKRYAWSSHLAAERFRIKRYFYQQYSKGESEYRDQLLEKLSLVEAELTTKWKVQLPTLLGDSKALSGDLKAFSEKIRSNNLPAEARNLIFKEHLLTLATIDSLPQVHHVEHIKRKLEIAGELGILNVSAEEMFDKLSKEKRKI